MIEQLTLERQGTTPPNHNLTITKSVRPVVPSQTQGEYPHYTPEYAFTAFPGAAPTASATLNIPIPQRPFMQGFPQGPHPQGPHQQSNHRKEPPLYRPTPP